MDNLSNFILNNAQTIRDGGIISTILKHIQFVNNSFVKNEKMPNLFSARLTGGYGAALFFGIVWILVLIAAIFLFKFYYNRSNPTRKSKRNKTENLITSIEKMRSMPFGDCIQLIVISIFLFPIILFLSLCLMNVVQIHNSIAKPTLGFNANSTQKVTFMLPALKKSLFHIRNYLSTFAERARENTAPVVEEIIQATKDMQKETMKDFNKKLMSRLGVENTFKYGAEMTNIVVQFFDVSNALLNNRTMYTQVINDIYPRGMNPTFALFTFILDIKNSFKHLQSCNTVCQELQHFFNQTFSEVEGFPDYSFATSFLFIMKQQNKTRQSVIAQTEHGRKEMEKTMAKTQAKMKILLDIDGTIRNMTGETWTKMDDQFSKIINLIDNITIIINSENTSNKISKYSKMLSIILLIPILCAIFVLIIALGVICYLFCLPPKSIPPALQYGIYFSLILISLIIMFSTVIFLYGGKFETELCRYLRTEQDVEVINDGNRLILDRYINDFLDETLPKLAKAMPKSDFPLPKPKNVLYGLIHRCRKDEPILAAIDAINSLDTSALSKPEVAAKFINVGRKLLIESLNETDPNKMLPPDMKNSLQQASQLGMFKEIDIPENLNKISRTPIFVKNADQKQPIEINILVDRLDKYFSAYAPEITDVQLFNKLKNDREKLMLLLQRFTLITDNLRSIFSNMVNIPPIKPVVDNLGSSLNNMLILLNNKTALFEIGNSYFDRIIVSSTPKKAAGIMAKFGPKMMSKLGHCRSIFDAYQSSVDTTCDVVVMKLNTYWLYLGTVGLLLTCFSSIVFLLMIRTSYNDDRLSATLELTQDMQPSVNKPLVYEIKEENQGKDII